MAIEQKRIRLTLTRWKSNWKKKPDFRVSFLLRDGIVAHLTRLISGKAFRITRLGITLDGVSVAYAYFGHDVWELIPNTPWLKGPTRNFSSLTEMIDYVCSRAELAGLKDSRLSPISLPLLSNARFKNHS